MTHCLFLTSDHVNLTLCHGVCIFRDGWVKESISYPSE